MRKDHRHILMSDWDFRFVSHDMPDGVVGRLDYKASNFEGELNTAAQNGCELADRVDSEARSLQGALTGHIIIQR
jgi:hypothetical protein